MKWNRIEMNGSMCHFQYRKSMHNGKRKHCEWLKRAISYKCMYNTADSQKHILFDCLLWTRVMCNMHPLYSFGCHLHPLPNSHARSFISFISLCEYGIHAIDTNIKMNKVYLWLRTLDSVVSTVPSSFLFIGHWYPFSFSLFRPFSLLLLFSLLLAALENIMLRLCELSERYGERSKGRGGFWLCFQQIFFSIDFQNTHRHTYAFHTCILFSQRQSERYKRLFLWN